jgi:hypothetical protein
MLNKMEIAHFVTLHSKSLSLLSKENLQIFDLSPVRF